MWRQLRAALAIVRENERKKKLYDELVGTELSYKILKDLINSAAYGVVIDITLKDGSKLVIRRTEDFDKLVADFRKGTW